MATLRKSVALIDGVTFASASEKGRRLLQQGPLATAAPY